MQAVVPSQVVAVVRQFFPSVSDELRRPIGLHSGQLEELLTIVSLVKEIPRELITVSVADYALLLPAILTIEETSRIRVRQQNMFPVSSAANGQDVVSVIHDVLAQCPDQYPPAAAVDLTFIPDAYLRENIRRDIGAIERAIANGEWKAATVLAGAAIEALLHWRLAQQPPSQDQINSATDECIRQAIFANPGRDRDRWTLEHFIGVAGRLNLIKADTAKAADLARGFRNLIHPGRAARLGQVSDKGSAYTAVGALEHVIRDLS